MHRPARTFRRVTRRLRWEVIARANRLTHPHAIFIGDSLTREWLEATPGFFLAHGRVSAGINGQTTEDMLARFDADVVAQAPAVVHIMAGTNDLWHGRPGPGSCDALYRLGAMVDRAQAAGIAVVLALPPPIAAGAAHLFGHPELLSTLREGVAGIAAKREIVSADYAEVLGDGRGGLHPPLTTDGVHLSRAGYRAIRPLAERALAAALQGRA